MSGGRRPLIAFVALTLGGGWLIGSTNPPGAWAEALVKPSFNPPAWWFAPVWTVLFVLIGLAGGLVWRAAPRSTAMRVWFAQLLLNFTWTPTYFTLHALGWALAVITALFVTLVVFIAASWRVQRAAAILFLPYALWIGYAVVLNATIFALN